MRPSWICAAALVALTSCENVSKPEGVADVWVVTGLRNTTVFRNVLRAEMLENGGCGLTTNSGKQVVTAGVCTIVFFSSN